MLKLPRECQEAIGRARTAAERVDDNDRTGLFSDSCAPRVLVYEGTSWLFLDEPKKAIDALNEALRLLDRGNQNVVLAALVDLGGAYAEAGELQEGCRILGETYVRLGAMGNSRGIERARRARERLQPREREPSVRELDERINAVDRQ